MTVETINGLIPFKLQGGADSFEKAYMPYFTEKGLSEEDARNVVSSIWLFANEQWSKGYHSADNDNDFDD